MYHHPKLFSGDPSDHNTINVNKRAKIKNLKWNASKETLARHVTTNVNNDLEMISMQNISNRKPESYVVLSMNQVV